MLNENDIRFPVSGDNCEHPAHIPHTMPPNPFFAPPKPAFTLQEEFYKVVQYVNDNIARVLKLEEGVRATLDNCTRTLNADNVAFKNLCVETYNAFAEKVYADVTSFKTLIENSYQLFQNNANMSYDNFKYEVNNNIKAFKESVNQQIAEIDSFYRTNFGTTVYNELIRLRNAGELAEIFNEVLAYKVNTDTFNQTVATLATKAEVETERQRINQFTSLPAGSTEGNAELVDIRASADGKNYDSAGNSVRGHYLSAIQAIETNHTMTKVSIHFGKIEIDSNNKTIKVAESVLLFGDKEYFFAQPDVDPRPWSRQETGAFAVVYNKDNGLIEILHPYDISDATKKLCLGWIFNNDFVGFDYTADVNIVFNGKQNALKSLDPYSKNGTSLCWLNGDIALDVVYRPEGDAIYDIVLSNVSANTAYIINNRYNLFFDANKKLSCRSGITSGWILYAVKDSENKASSIEVRECSLEKLKTEYNNIENEGYFIICCGYGLYLVDANPFNTNFVYNGKAFSFGAFNLAKLNDPDSDGISDIPIPTNVDVMVGRETNIYYDTLSRFKNAHDLYRFVSDTKTFYRNEDCLYFTPTENDADFSAVVHRIGSQSAETIETKQLNFHVNKKLTTPTTKYVCICGDSLVNDDTVSEEVYRMLGEDGDCNIVQVGTRGVRAKHEGRGSWRWADYLMGEEWYGTTNAFWDSQNNRLDFQKYCLNNGIERIDYFLIALGTNDVSQGYNTYNTLESVQHFIAQAKQFINALLSADRGFPNCKIGVALPAIGSDYFNLANANSYVFRKSMNTLNHAYLKAFDNGVYHPNVTCFSISMITNRKYAYGYDIKATSSRFEEDNRFVKNPVHPSPAGYKAWADAYYNKIRGWLTEDANN